MDEAIKGEKVAKAIDEVFEAAGQVSAYPVFDGGKELAPETIAALECGMSVALVAAAAIARGKTEGMPPERIATNMKMTTVKTYVENVVFGGNQQESEAENGDE